MSNIRLVISPPPQIRTIVRGGGRGDGLQLNDLVSAPTTQPIEPNALWLELPGRVLRVTAPWLLDSSGAWDDDGAWYDSQIWD